MSNPVQVIAVTGGKGGVGRSSVSVNLGIALSQMGRRVVLLDADLGLANIDVLLGLTAGLNISDVLAGSVPCGHPRGRARRDQDCSRLLLRDPTHDQPLPDGARRTDFRFQ